jgi:anti-sigma factor RsiW
MTCTHYQAEIDDHVDGTLPAERAAALEAHLAGCATCRAMATDFRVLRAAAANLERKAPPPHVWTRLAASLDAGRTRDVRSPWLGARWSWRPAFAVAALVTILAGATWVAWRQAATPRPAPVAQNVAPRETAGLQMPAQVLTQEIAHLEAVVTADGEVLPEETRAVYQATGGVIDDAIGHTRAVLQTEPSNELAQESLFEALRSKLALLQDMVALINEMRKGNQEEAARIVSGMEP